jgi:hypothetical protein
MQVYLSDELHAAVKERGLRASELLQTAVRSELRRLDLLDAADRYLEDLIAEVGEPTPAERARAAAIAQRISDRVRTEQAS